MEKQRVIIYFYIVNTGPLDIVPNEPSYILHNRKFIGEYSYRDIVVPNGIPAIVPQDLFDRVQEE